MGSGVFLAAAAATCLCVLQLNPLLMCLAEPREYCTWQHFNPRCGRQEVVFMHSALYGRMQSGQCIERDYGYVGCYSDVLTLADSLCSGRHDCNLKIPVERFARNSTCPRDLSRYLMADYSCEKVVTPNRTYCYSQKTAMLPPTSGTIASITTEETSCGSTETPWLLRTQPGQTVNFTLFDFALKSAIYNDSRARALATHCHVYAIFKERSTGRSKTICGGDVRVSAAYKTTSSEVEIRIMGGNTAKHFMLKYEVHGCPDPVSPEGGWARRHDNTLTIGCDQGSEEWTLKCEDGQWRGQAGNCTTQGTVTTGELAFAGIPFTLTLSIVVIVAVALVIGVLILAVGLLCLKRRRMHMRSGGAANAPFGPFGPPGYKDDMNYKTTSTTCTGYSQPSFMTRTDTSGENDYEYVDDILKPPPPPVDVGTTFGKGVPHTGTTCAAHGAALNQYGFDASTADFNKMRQLPPGMHMHHIPVAGTMIPQYYELDPDTNAPVEGGKGTPLGPGQQTPSSSVTRALSEEETTDSGTRQTHRQNMNFGHYSQ